MNSNPVARITKHTPLDDGIACIYLEEYEYAVSQLKLLSLLLELLQRGQEDQIPADVLRRFTKKSRRLVDTALTSLDCFAARA